jgi:hypothetical protein
MSEQWGIRWEHVDGLPDVTGPYATEDEARDEEANSAFSGVIVRRTVSAWEDVDFVSSAHRAPTTAGEGERGEG